MPPVHPFAYTVDACYSVASVLDGNMACRDEGSARAAVSCCYEAGNHPGTCAVSVCDSARGGSPPLTPLADATNASFREAVTECHARGMRLCTPAELRGCCGCLGGTFQASPATRATVWSQSACDPELESDVIAVGVLVLVALVICCVVRCCCRCWASATASLSRSADPSPPYQPLAPDASEGGGSALIATPITRPITRARADPSARLARDQPGSSPVRSKERLGKTQPAGRDVVAACEGNAVATEPVATATTTPSPPRSTSRSTPSPSKPAASPTASSPSTLSPSRRYKGGAIKEVDDLETEYLTPTGKKGKRERTPPKKGSSPALSPATPTALASTTASPPRPSSNPMPAGPARDAVHRKLKFARQQLAIATSAVLSARGIIDVWKKDSTRSEMPHQL